MLYQRLATSAVLISIVVALIYLDHRFPTGGLWLLPLLLFFSVGTAIDVTRLWRSANYPVRPLPTKIGVAIVVLIASVPMLWPLSGELYPADCPVGRLGWISVGAIVALGLAIGNEMFRYRPGETGAAGCVMTASFTILYIGVPMAFLVAIRCLGSSHWGLAALISLVAATKAADAGAYFTGRAIGRHKLIPRLSPGKTIEGALGGVAASIGVSFAMFHWLIPALTGTPIDYPIWGPIVFGLVCSNCGMFGDLAESLMKRDSGAKDSGNLLPGLGGVWDVTDSLIATALPGFLCFAIGVAGAPV